MLFYKVNNPFGCFNKSHNLPFRPFSFQVVKNKLES
jgi:hypothetical protein